MANPHSPNLKAIGFLLIAFMISISETARILGIFPTPSISHQVVFRAIMEELAKRGHTLIILTTDPVHYKEKEYSNITEIDVHNLSYEIFARHMNFVEMKEDSPSPSNFLMRYYESLMEMSEKQIDSPQMKKLLQNPEERFDLCFIESLAPLYYPLKDRFNCSLILISSLSGTISNFNSFGVPSNPIIYPDIFSEHLGTDLDFWQRLSLVYNYLQFCYTYYWLYMDKFTDMAEKLFGNVRSLDEIEREADMLFYNVNPLIGGIRPTVPSMIFMGNMHIKKAKPLPSKYQKILNESVNGAIYFSLGSNVKSVDLSEEIRNCFLEAFGEMPYTVLWKWENETLSNKPPNVHIFKWMPQQDVLAHPNIKVFITQGGQQSMEESIDRKVPLVGIPFLADQELNIKKFVKFGIGLGIDLESISKEVIKNSVTEVIKNPSYRLNIEKLSDLIYDQPQSSMERTIWWTEYVLRHKDMKHLRSPAIDIPFYQYFLLDIIGFVLLCILSILIISVLVVAILIYIAFPACKGFPRKNTEKKKV